jgi:hypothetical protein
MNPPRRPLVDSIIARLGPTPAANPALKQAYEVSEAAVLGYS